MEIPMGTMDDHNLLGPGRVEMSDLSGVLIQQKFDLQEIFCPACQKRNRYKIKSDNGWNPSAEIKSFDESPWDASKTIMKATEESDLCCRLCLQSSREFNMFIREGEEESGAHLYKFHRPFKMACCCGMCCPNQISVYDASNNPLGSVVQECRASTLCCNMWWHVKDSSGNPLYYLNDNLCNRNMCAPSWCCPVHDIQIMDHQENNTDGHIKNIFPGCSCKGMAGQGMRDSYHLKFPKTADPNQRALLMAGLFLIEYMVFEHDDSNED